MSRSPVPVFALVMSLAVLAFAPGATANGRFPAASYVVVGPAGASSLLALRTTFGVLRSADAGRTWTWVCEASVDAVGMFDPSLAVGSDGTTVMSLPSGLAASTDGCAWRRPDGTPARPVVDLSQDATGRVIVAGAGPSGTQDALLRSDDGGRTWRTTATLPGYFLETVEVAPSSPMRVYASAFVPGPEPVLLRSDDGGATVREATRDFGGGISAWIAGVDPTNPDVLYVRSQRPGGGPGTYLLRSTDGGATFARIAETEGAMRGFALSDDGSSVWYGSADPREGLRRSVRGGAFERAGAQPSVLCLRYHAGLLYVCADEAVDGYALGCSNDGGERFAPILSLRALEGPGACAAGTSVGDACPALWPTQQRTLRTIDAGAVPDAAPHDAGGAREETGGDAAVAIDVAVPIDAAAPIDARLLPAPPARSGCACGASGASSGEGAALCALAGVAAASARRRRGATARGRAAGRAPGRTCRRRSTSAC